MGCLFIEILFATGVYLKNTTVKRGLVNRPVLYDLRGTT